MIHLALALALAQEDPFRWSEDYDAGLADARLRGRPTIVVWGAMWCVGCRKFQETTLASKEVQAQAGHFSWVRIDIDRRVSLARAHAIVSTPTIELVDAQGRTGVRIEGFLPPASFLERLAGFLARPPSDANETEKWETVPGDVHTPLTWTPQGFRGHAICFSNVGYGPLRLPSQSPFQSFRFGLMPRTPSTLSAGKFELRQSETWVNIFARNEDDWLLDFEMLRSSLAFGFGLSDTFAIEVEITDKSRFGGKMDGLVQGFHDTFGVDQGGRDEFSKGGFAFDVENRVNLDGDDRGTFSRELMLTLTHNITCGTEELPAIAYSVTLRTDFADSDDLDGGSALDVALSVSVAKRWGDFYGYLALGFAWFGGEEFRGIELRSTQISALLALEWRFAPSMSLVLQYLGSQGVAEDLGDFSKPSHELTIGWKGEVAVGVVLEVGLIENVLTSDNSPDFGIHAGWSIRW